MKVVFKITDPPIQHIFKHDLILKEIILKLGNYTLNLNKNYYLSLVSSIVSQQLSTKVAAIIFKRLQDLCQEVTPEKLLSLEFQDLRDIGLSKQKITYLKSLSDAIHNKSLNLNNLDNLSDEEVIQELIKIKGIGKWTAQMFLIFSLGRPDIFPILDFGIKQSISQLYQLSEPLNIDQANQIAKNWKPYRSIASLYLWKAYSQGITKEI